jgi:inorganic pyrophosphatase
MSVETKYGETILKQTQEIADMFKQAMPKVTTNKNGYEIRTKVLEMAQNQMWQDYHAKYGQFETAITKDGDEVVTKVTMPEIPGADAVLEAANKFYDFVNGKQLNNR